LEFCNCDETGIELASLKKAFAEFTSKGIETLFSERNRRRSEIAKCFVNSGIDKVFSGIEKDIVEFIRSTQKVRKDKILNFKRLQTWQSTTTAKQFLVT